MSFYMQAGNQPTKIRCDCAERFGVTINSYKQFEELKAFFEGQAEKGIFRDIPGCAAVLYWKKVHHMK